LGRRSGWAGLGSRRGRLRRFRLRLWSRRGRLFRLGNRGRLLPLFLADGPLPTLGCCGLGGLLRRLGGGVVALSRRLRRRRGMPGRRRLGWRSGGPLRRLRGYGPSGLRRLGTGRLLPAGRLWRRRGLCGARCGRPEGLRRRGTARRGRGRAQWRDPAVPRRTGGGLSRRADRSGGLRWLLRSAAGSGRGRALLSQSEQSNRLFPAARATERLRGTLELVSAMGAAIGFHAGFIAR
jgi:hypothetical protein